MTTTRTPDAVNLLDARETLIECLLDEHGDSHGRLKVDLDTLLDTITDAGPAADIPARALTPPAPGQNTALHNKIHDALHTEFGPIVDASAVEITNVAWPNLAPIAAETRRRAAYINRLRELASTLEADPDLRIPADPFPVVEGSTA